MKCFFYTLLLLIVNNCVTAQSLAINTTGATANSSAILDVQSTAKGMLIPRMSKGQKNAIASPAIGLLVYQALPDSVGFHYYNGSAWIWLNPSSGGGNDWSLTGNAETDTAVNFIGTTNNMPLVLKVNNEKSGQIESDITTANTFLGNRSGMTNAGEHNTALGFRALSAITSGNNNTAIGSTALENLSVAFMSNNVGVGYRALQNSSGSYNVGVGVESLRQSSGNGNVAIGNWVLQNNTTGLANVAAGYYAMLSNTTGRSNIAFGMLPLYNNTSGSYNIAIGDSAAYSSINISHVVAIGSKALYANTAGTNITAIGDSALYSNTTGYKNIAMGNSALVKNTTGYQNIAIGYNTLKNNQTGFANIAIGDSVLSASTAQWNIGIGKSALLETTTGDKNIGIGASALANNITGANNVAIGYSSQSAANTNNRNNTSLGFRSASSMQGYSNTAIGADAMGKPAVTYTVNNTVAVGDSVLFNIATGASYNTAVGTKALFLNTSGRTNSVVGARALYNNTTGSYNVAVGDSAAANSSAISHLVAIGSKALYTNTAGTELTAIGDSALYSNSTGDFNTAVGNAALRKNTTGDDNVALGYKALYSSTAGTSNTAVGNSALFSVVFGGANTAVGYSTLNKNTVSSNTAIGYNAMAQSTTGSINTAIGVQALENNGALADYNVAIGGATLRNNTGSSNIGIGYNVLGLNDGGFNIGIGSEALLSNVSGSANIGLGETALYFNNAGMANIATGRAALFHNLSGGYNVAIGDSASFNSARSNQVAVGAKALRNNTTGTGNTAIGYQSMYSNTTGSNNTVIGNSAAQNNTGSGNVFIGYNAAQNEVGSNKLYIANSNVATPLIYGDFSSNLLRVNGTLNINNDYSLPVADGTINQVLRTNGAGTLSWVTLPAGESTTASNGLTLTGVNVALGGSLTGSTAINHFANDFTSRLNGVGRYLFGTNTEEIFSVTPSKNIGVRTYNPLYKFHVVNTDGSDAAFGSDIMIENTNAITTGVAAISYKNNGPDGLPVNRSWMAGMSKFTNFVVAYGDTLKSANVKMKVDTLGNVSIGNQGSAAENKLDVKGSFGNAIRVINADETLDGEDHTVIIGTGVGNTALTITLPAPNTCNRREYVIVNRNAFTKTVSIYNDFSGTSTVIPLTGSIKLQSNGSSWFRIE